MTIDHGSGLDSTYSWVSALLVHKGDVVTEGEQITRSGNGHPGDSIPSLHFGVKLNGIYVDPLLYLRAPSVTSFIRLAPLPPGYA
ncbi:MAG: M23 family metallopeptidase [Actinomycetota bacterium]|nr:M23 family metallopeptidase [Actinomycetota bacterium]